jgi:methionyl aminopeptidase
MAILIDEESREYFIKAGQIAGKALNYACKTIKPGMPMRELLDKTEQKIIDLGGEPAFPAQASINDFAAHFCPDIEDKTEFKEEDVIKLDVGAHVEGFVGDNAKTIYFGKNPEIKKLVEASKQALHNSIKLLKIGIPVREIGAEINRTISSYGFNPIKNLSGHGLGVYEQHDSPNIPNYDSGDEAVLEENEMIAIEPFATTGIGFVKDDGASTLFSKVNTRNARNPFAREILKEINRFDDLPFCSYWLQKKLGIPRTRVGLHELKNLEILREFPPLREKSNGLVSQHEHSFLIGKKTIITTMVDDDE